MLSDDPSDNVNWAQEDPAPRESPMIRVCPSPTDRMGEQGLVSHENKGHSPGPLQVEDPISMEYSGSFGDVVPEIICCVGFCHPKHHVVSALKDSA